MNKISRQGNVSVRDKKVYKAIYSKAEVNFARQFGYKKALHLQGMWIRVSTPKAKKFKECAKKEGLTDYIIDAFISAKRSK